MKVGERRMAKNVHRDKKRVNIREKASMHKRIK